MMLYWDIIGLHLFRIKVNSNLTPGSRVICGLVSISWSLNKERRMTHIDGGHTVCFPHSNHWLGTMMKGLPNLSHSASVALSMVHHT